MRANADKGGLLAGHSYLFDERSFVTAFAANVTECAYVDDDAAVVKYQPQQPEHRKVK